MCQPTSGQEIPPNPKSHAVSEAPMNYSPDKAVDIMLAEFSALRAEIDNRTSAQQRISYSMLFITGTLITLGINQREILLLLISPVLTLFLAIRYADHDAQIARVGDYIERRIENRLRELSWEHWLYSDDAHPCYGRSGRARGLAWRGIFVSMQVFPIGVALLRFWPEFTFPPTNSVASLVFHWFLLVSDIFIVFYTWIVLRHRRLDD